MKQCPLSKPSGNSSKYFYKISSGGLHLKIYKCLPQNEKVFLPWADDEDAEVPPVLRWGALPPIQRMRSFQAMSLIPWVTGILYLFTGN